MPMLSFRNSALTALALLLLATGYVFLRTVAFPDPSWPLDKGERVTLPAQATLTQPFAAHRDGLRQVEILLGKFTLKESDRLTLELRDEECAAVLSRTELKNESFDSEHTYAFIFDRIPDSEGRRFCLAASFSSGRNIPKDKTPRFFTDLSAEAASYTLEGAEAGRTVGSAPVAIRPGYRPATLAATGDELTDRISQYKPPFLKGGFLVVFAALGLILTVGAACLLVRGFPKVPHDD